MIGNYSTATDQTHFQVEQSVVAVNNHFTLCAYSNVSVCVRVCVCMRICVLVCALACLVMWSMSSAPVLGCEVETRQSQDPLFGFAIQQWDCIIHTSYSAQESACTRTKP